MDRLKIYKISGIIVLLIAGLVFCEKNKTKVKDDNTLGKKIDNLLSF